MTERFTSPGSADLSSSVASLNGRLIPVVMAPRVYHVGTLSDVPPPRQRRYSLEGHAVSVSVDPAAWQRIARLGGQTRTIEMNGHPLLDMLRIEEGAFAGLRSAVDAFALKSGLAVPGTVYRSETIYEDEDIGWSFHSTYEEALQEAYGDPDAVAEVQQLVPTERLAKLARVEKVDLSLVRDFITMQYAEQILDLPGVWWAETYAPEHLSAPRGGIFPRELGRGRLTFKNREPLAAPPDCLAPGR